MPILGVIVVACLAYLLLSPRSTSAPSLEPRVTIQMARNHAFYTDVILNDRVRVTGALVDTGASSVSLMCDSVVKQLALPLGDSVTVRTANGRKITRATTFASVKIGSIEVRNVAGNVSKQVDADCMLLVGNTFLRQLKSVTLTGDRLQLVGRSTSARRKGS